MNHMMNDALPRCTVPGSTCRLLQFESSGPRPVWAVLDGAGARRFTGQVTLHLDRTVHAYFQDGELYFAERDGDRTLTERLVDYGVVSALDLEAGTVHLGPINHLGRLFDRVPTIDRDQVELALEVITGELLGEIADHTVVNSSIATYRHHSSGVNKWLRKSSASSGSESVAYDAPITELDQSIITDYEALTAAGLLAPTSTVEELTVVAEMTVIDEPNRTAEQNPTEEPTVIDEVLIPEIPAYYSSAEPAPRPEPAAVAERPGTITERIQFRDPLLDPEHASPNELAAERPNVPAFDLSRVIEAVAKENDGLSVPFGDDADIADDVRAAVREALAEIEAATRPRPSDVLSPAALERALEAAGSTSWAPVTGEPDATLQAVDDATASAPWLPERSAREAELDDAGDAHRDAGEESTQVADTPGIGLRRLIGGPRKP